MKLKISLLHLSLLREDIRDEFESVDWVETRVASNKLALLDHFHVQDVIHQTDQQVYLRDDQ